MDFKQNEDGIDLILPSFVWLFSQKKEKKYILNLNGYRNWHYHINNKLKKAFASNIVFKHLKPIEGKITVEYVFVFKDKRKRDIGNYMAVVDKFFLDGLVKHKIIEDDNYQIVTKISGSIRVDKNIEEQICEIKIRKVK